MTTQEIEGAGEDSSKPDKRQNESRAIPKAGLQTGADQAEEHEQLLPAAEGKAALLPEALGEEPL